MYRDPEPSRFPHPGVDQDRSAEISRYANPRRQIVDHPLIRTPGDRCWPMQEYQFLDVPLCKKSPRRPYSPSAKTLDVVPRKKPSARKACLHSCLMFPSKVSSPKVPREIIARE